MALEPRVPRRSGPAVRPGRRNDRGPADDPKLAMTADTRLQVEVGGRPLEVLDLPGCRDRPALILLHEGLGSVGLWRGFPALLHEAAGRRLVAYSRYGHGRSAPPPTPRTPDFFHEEALEILPRLLDELGVSYPVLIGHS